VVDRCRAKRLWKQLTRQSWRSTGSRRVTRSSGHYWRHPPGAGTHVISTSSDAASNVERPQSHTNGSEPLPSRKATPWGASACGCRRAANIRFASRGCSRCSPSHSLRFVQPSLLHSRDAVDDRDGPMGCYFGAGKGKIKAGAVTPNRVGQRTRSRVEETGPTVPSVAYFTVDRCGRRTDRAGRRHWAQVRITNGADSRVPESTAGGSPAKRRFSRRRVAGTLRRLTDVQGRVIHEILT
jgi:hypothetical protein